MDTNILLLFFEELIRQIRGTISQSAPRHTNYSLIKLTLHTVDKKSTSRFFVIGPTTKLHNHLHVIADVEKRNSVNSNQ